MNAQLQNRLLADRVSFVVLFDVFEHNTGRSCPILCSALNLIHSRSSGAIAGGRIEATLPTVSPEEFRRERNQDDCGYDQQSQLHPKVAEQAATACLTTLHVHL